MSVLWNSPSKIEGGGGSMTSSKANVDIEVPLARHIHKSMYITKLRASSRFLHGVTND